jgi:hypothetical protein
VGAIGPWLISSQKGFAMTQDKPQVLNYAVAATQPGAFARRPLWVIVLVAVVLPGVSSWLICRRGTGALRLLLLAIVPAGF